jgi:endonuclease/exonuclease/phosphatase family metal-dependent hydrolase
MADVTSTSRLSRARTRDTVRLARFGCIAALGSVLASCAPARSPVAPPATVPVPADAIRAMTFNIRYGTAPDGENAWPLRRDLTLRAIRDFDPIVLGVQEALRFQLDEIGAEFPDLGEIGVGRDDGIQAGEYSAIFYDRRRLEPLDHGTFWLSDSSDVPGSTSWGNRIPRIVTWAHFRDRANGAAFHVFNTHWDHESQPARERSADFLLERAHTIAGPDSPIIVTGDFNAGESNPAFRTLVAGSSGAASVQLRDTFRAVHPDATATGTFNAFRGDQTGDKIDAVLATRHWRILDAEIVTLAAGSRYPSDHYPVTAILRLMR